jgi:hypothetical protein
MKLCRICTAPVPPGRRSLCGAECSATARRRNRSAQNQRRYQRHRETRLANATKYREQNREVLALKQRAYRRLGRERHNAYMKRWRLTDKGKAATLRKEAKPARIKAKAERRLRWEINNPEKVRDHARRSRERQQAVMEKARLALQTLDQFGIHLGQDRKYERGKERSTPEQKSKYNSDARKRRLAFIEQGKIASQTLEKLGIQL